MLKKGKVYEPCGHTSHYTCIPPRDKKPGEVFLNEGEFIDFFMNTLLVLTVVCMLGTLGFIIAGVIEGKSKAQSCTCLPKT